MQRTPTRSVSAPPPAHNVKTFRTMASPLMLHPTHTTFPPPAALRLLFGPPSSNSNTAGGAPRPRFYGSGTTSGRPVGRSQSQGGMGRTLRAALGQLGLVAAAVAVYALASQRRQTQPMSNWRLR